MLSDIKPLRISYYLDFLRVQKQSFTLWCPKVI